MIEKRWSELNFVTLTNRDFFPSPTAWEDQVLYFLMLDRFSDGKEQGYCDNEGNIVASGITPMFKNEDRGNATKTAGGEKSLVRSRREIRRRHAERAGEQNGLFETPRRDRDLGQPDFQASRFSGFRSRLRHSELSRCGPAFPHAPVSTNMNKIL